MSKVNIKLAAGTDVGLVRKNNEDNLLFHGNILEEEHLGIVGEWNHSPISTQEIQMYGVFDGMGGHSKGEYASYIAASTAKKAAEFLKVAVRDEIIVLDDICKRANHLICRKSKEEMIITGTTLSILIIKGGKYWSCNLGDSPIFRIRDGEITSLYEEHTEKSVDEISYGKDKARGKSYPLTQYVGIPEDELKLEPYVQYGDINRGDIFLLCSDGMTDMVSEKQICEILFGEDELGNKIKHLEQCSLENGGKDNITIIGVEIL